MLTTVNSAALLWSDREVLEWKAEKAVAALYAVAETLGNSRRRDDATDEFLALCDWTETLDADTFRHVATDPACYHWTRLAFQLVNAAEHESQLPPTAQRYLDWSAGGDIGQGLRRHLELFKVLVLAMAVAARREVSFRPLPIDLPLAIPGTRWSLEGSAQVELSGLSAAGAVVGLVDGSPAALPLPGESLQWSQRLAIQAAPAVQAAGRWLVLQPHAFNVPGLTQISSVVAAGVPFQWQVRESVAEALRAVERYAESTFQQLAASMRVLALKPATAGGVQNTSCSRLPGAAVFTAASHPLVLAEDLVHEFHHNRLFALEEAGGFFESDDYDPVADEQFYSPWRQDPRPFYGLFHALYVFERVMGFWMAVRRDGQLDEPTRRYAQSRVACLRVQLEVTWRQLDTLAAFTEFGRGLFRQLVAAVGEQSREADRLGVDAGAASWIADEEGSFTEERDAAGRRLTVAQLLCRHRAQFDVFGRCAALAGDCSPAARRALGVA